MWVNRWESKRTVGSTLISGSHDALKLEQFSATNRVGYTIYGVNDYPLNCTTPVGSWTHLAFVDTSAGMSVYSNGILAASVTRSLRWMPPRWAATYSTFTDYLDATLDDVRVYNQRADSVANYELGCLWQNNADSRESPW